MLRSYSKFLKINNSGFFKSQTKIDNINFIHKLIKKD